MILNHADDFKPLRLLSNPHAQTLFASLAFPKAPALVRERIELRDGDFLDADVAVPACAKEGSPWVLVLHGLEGSSAAPYMLRMARGLTSRGIEACLLNLRGCSGPPNRLGRSYHSGETDDVRAAFMHLAARRIGRSCGMIGFSVGGNLVMKFLGEAGSSAPALLKTAVAISPPFTLEGAARTLDRWSGAPYRAYFIRTLRAKALAKIAQFPGLADSRRVRAATTFAQFDEAFTAPVHGFRDARDYWTRCSGGGYLDAIARDLLVLTSADDPFFPADYIPASALAMHRHVHAVVTKRGGHVGFVGGSTFAPDFWAEVRAADHVARTFADESGMGLSVAPGA